MFHTEHNISRVLCTSIEEFMSMIFPIDKLFIRYYCTACLYFERRQLKSTAIVCDFTLLSSLRWIDYSCCIVTVLIGVRLYRLNHLLFLQTFLWLTGPCLTPDDPTSITELKVAETKIYTNKTNRNWWEMMEEGHFPADYQWINYKNRMLFFSSSVITLLNGTKML